MLGRKGARVDEEDLPPFRACAQECPGGLTLGPYRLGADDQPDPPMAQAREVGDSGSDRVLVISEYRAAGDGSVGKVPIDQN